MLEGAWAHVSAQDGIMWKEGIFKGEGLNKYISQLLLFLI